MWTSGPFESKSDARLLLPHRRRSGVAARAAGRAPARLQLPDALVDLDPRGLSGPFPALPAPTPGRVEGAQIHPLRAGVVRRRLGALLRADDGRGRVRPRRLPASSWDSSPRRSIRLARFIVVHQAAHRGHVGRAGSALLPRRGVHGRSRARDAKPSAARSIRHISSTPPAS